LNSYQREKALSRLITLAVAAISLLCLGAFFPAGAQSLKEKVTGTWIFESGSDNFPDGRKLSSWVAGSLMLDSTGHVSLFLIGSDRQKANPNIRTPVGPVVAFFGTYTIDEAKNMLTFKISYGSSPLFDGAVRTQEISFSSLLKNLEIVGFLF
jgi:hypothetical protein